MGLSIGLLIASICLHLFYFFTDYSALNKKGEMISFFFGVAIVGIIISTATFFYNLAKMINRKNQYNLYGMILAITAFSIFVAYLVVRFFTRMYEAAITLF